MENLTTSFDNLDERKKVIAVDFDGVISEDNDGWLVILKLLKKLNYSVIIATYRNPNQNEELLFLQKEKFNIFFTSKKAKKEYLLERGIRVDIWIDDDIETILKSNLF